MKNNAFIYGVIGVVVGAILVWVVTVTTINANNIGMMHMMGFGNISSNLNNKSTVLDAHFIEQMIPHHEDAISMAELAQTKAQHPEIKQLAESIIDSQGKEIDQMKEWYNNWFGKDVPVGENVMGQHGMMNSSTMHMGMMGDDTDISRLETASDFDIVFIEEMIPHHQMAIMMAQMLRSGTNRPEMKQLADDIIDAQSTEIDQMRQWYREWK